MPVAGGGERDALSGDLGRPARHVAQQFAGEGQIDAARIGDRLAVVEAFDLRELIGMRLEHIREFPDQPAALGRLHPRPWSGLEGDARRGHCRVDIRGATLGRLGDLLAARRIGDREALAGFRIDPGIADQQPVGLRDEGLHGFAQATMGAQDIHAFLLPISIFM